MNRAGDRLFSPDAISEPFERHNRPGQSKFKIQHVAPALLDDLVAVGVRVP
jgi:hypothetical protein